MESELYAADPAVRLSAARQASPRLRKALSKRVRDWPAHSPAAANVWLLLVTSKDPNWRDPYMEWRDVAPTLGDPPEGFLYPDPLGFWSEVRHWVCTALAMPPMDAISVAGLLHGPNVDWAVQLTQPRVLLFLDEPAWAAASAHVLLDRRPVPHHIPDPYRPGKTYEGWWARAANDVVVGKAPQHPAAHKLYSRSDMDSFLTGWRSA